MLSIEKQRQPRDKPIVAIIFISLFHHLELKDNARRYSSGESTSAIDNKTNYHVNNVVNDEYFHIGTPINTVFLNP